MTPEGKVKKKITALLKELGVFYFMPIGGAYSASGVSDYICCVNGRFVAVEAKANDKAKPTALQNKFMDGVVGHKGNTFLVYDDSSLAHLRSMIILWQQK
jgi:hypothetical protein